MSNKRIRVLKKDRGWGRHAFGEILPCIHCERKLIVGIDDIVSRMITSVNSHTVYYCLKDAKELNIIV
jgi:hypothetical protein